MIKEVPEVTLLGAKENIKGGFALFALVHSDNPKKAAALKELNELKDKILDLLDIIVEEPRRNA